MIPWGVAAVAMVLNGMHSDKTGERRWHAAGGLLVAVVGLIALALVGPCGGALHHRAHRW